MMSNTQWNDYPGLAVQERRLPPVSSLPDAPEDIKRHFRDNYPVLLDGALFAGSDQGLLLRQARESVLRGGAHPSLLPAGILRETLAAVRSTAKPDTKAGMIPVSPRRMRIWWDPELLGNLDDVMADLAKPKPIMRFYDITGLDSAAGTWNSSFDLDFQPDVKAKSVDFWTPDRQYVVDLGFLYADGRFLQLARTNPAALPRDCGGNRNPAETAVTNLPPNRCNRAALVPDSRARAWAEPRPDCAERDVDSELVVHMLYRTFLEEGPRVLRQAAQPVRRDASTLKREFAQRSRRRERLAAAARTAQEEPALLIARLDSHRLQADAELRHLPTAPSALTRLAGDAAAYAGRFAFYHDLVRFARRDIATARSIGLVAPPASAPDTPAPTTLPESAETAAKALVQPAPDAVGLSFADAAPVFEAARRLRDRLAALPSTPVSPNAAGHAPRRFGGGESRRLAGTDSRISRTALLLEGRVKPGARLRVAGRVVEADADGRFCLECQLSERRSRIPVYADGAKNYINVEWDRR